MDLPSGTAGRVGWWKEVAPREGALRICLVAGDPRAECHSGNVLNGHFAQSMPARSLDELPVRASVHDDVILDHDVVHYPGVVDDHRRSGLRNDTGTNARGEEVSGGYEDEGSGCRPAKACRHAYREAGRHRSPP